MRVIVLGAGVIGVTSAWYLAELGHDVTVVERRAEPGLETSFANGGQISAGHAEPWARPSVLPKVLRWLGREDAPLLFRPRADWAQWEWGLRFMLECLPGRFEKNCRALAGLATYSRECLDGLRERTAIQYDHLGKGILQFITDPRDLDAIAAHGNVKTAAECLAIEPALRHSEERILGGVYHAGDESGDAFKFTTSVAALARAKGVVFEFNKSVSAIKVNDDRVVGLEGFDIQGDAYVIALGSYSRSLLTPLGIRIPVYPMKGYSITLPLGLAEQAVAPSVSLTDEAHKIVISRLGNRLRAAGTAELTGYDTSINAIRCAAIAARIRQLFPQLGALATVANWSGLRPATPNNIPVLGATRLKNLFLNTGHGTLGWTLACGSGKALADVISGRTPEVEFPFHA